MKLATSSLIREIDTYAEEKLNIPTRVLMERAGRAVADAALAMTESGDRILVLCGKGNNGGDGYAASLRLRGERRVALCDVFGGGQRSPAGRYFLEECVSAGIELISGEKGELRRRIAEADLIIDAIFGTGFAGELGEELSGLADAINSSSAQVLAVDLPLGISADGAEADPHSVRADLTVALTMQKPAHVSYPAKEFMGAVRLSDIGLGGELSAFDSGYYSIDHEFASLALPRRDAKANKGSFGRILHLTGSDKYRGAAHLALEASLRAGVGIVCHIGTEELNRELRLKFPEVIYIDGEASSSANREAYQASDESEAVKGSLLKGELSCVAEALSGKYASVLVGSGSSASRGLAETVTKIIRTEGAPLVLDADGINSLAEYGSAEILRTARRSVVLTPHPLEFSRISGLSVEYIGANRISAAKAFAGKYGVILLLKGAGTVITDGERVFINTTGSTALSKGGSGDVLAGLCASFVALCEDTLSAVALAAYLHGRAGDTLSAELSDFGVTPSDLPKEIARLIKLIADGKA